MKTRRIPTFDEIEEGKEVLTIEQQTIIAELSIVNGYYLGEISLPMVKDMTGGKTLVKFFQDCIAAELVALGKAELISDEFLRERGNIFDAETGIKPGMDFSCKELYQLAYDITYMLGLYLAAMGLEDERVGRYNQYYHSDVCFEPYHL